VGDIFIGEASHRQLSIMSNEVFDRLKGSFLEKMALIERFQGELDHANNTLHELRNKPSIVTPCDVAYWNKQVATEELELVKLNDHCRHVEENISHREAELDDGVDNFSIDDKSLRNFMQQRSQEANKSTYYMNEVFGPFIELKEQYLMSGEDILSSKYLDDVKKTLGSPDHTLKLDDMRQTLSDKNEHVRKAQTHFATLEALYGTADNISNSKRSRPVY
jgi:hypothetical protein